MEPLGRFFARKLQIVANFQSLELIPCILKKCILQEKAPTVQEFCQNKVQN